MTSLLTAILVTCATAPLVRWLALRAGFLDVPNHRSSHTAPTPRVGGLACVAGVLAASVVGQLRDVEIAWWVLAGALAMAAVGLADDRASISTVLRLALQVVVGAVAGFALGGPVLAAAGALAVPVVVNAVNFMDGINAISSLTIAVWGLTATAAGAAESVPELAALGAAVAGAALGFLPWNAPRARLFLGDVGSYFFGAVLALGVLLGGHEGVPVMVLLAPLSVYAADTAFTLLRRARRGEPILEAHRSHVYQRLTNERGLPHVVAAAFVAALAAVITACWWWLPTLAALAASAVLLGVYLCSPALGSTGRTDRTAVQ